MEQYSALMDGELEENEAGTALSRLKHEPELQEFWEVYHLIGDAMRGEHLLSPRFKDQLMQRLGQEPTVLAPPRRPARRTVTYALSAAASAAAVAMVAWVALSTGNVATAPDAQVASAGPATAATPMMPVQAEHPQIVSFPSDGRMNEYFLAHQGFSPSTAIQGVTPYIRSVAASQPPGGTR